MFQRLARWFTPSPDPDRATDLRATKDHRLLASYLLVITAVIGFFSLFDLLSGKTISATINLGAWIPLLALVLVYRATAAYLPAVIGAVGICQLLLGIQHLHAPDGLLANLFWPPILTMMSVHLIGRRGGLILGLSTSFIVVLAGVLRPTLALEGDAFTPAEIYEFHLVSLGLTVIVGAYIAGRLATEVDQVFRRLETQKAEIFDLYETNSALLSMIGHDLNNHLMVVDLRLSLMAPEVPEQVGESFGVVREQVDRIMKIVEQTNAINAVRSGKLSIRPVPVDLRAALDQALELFQGELEERTIEVKRSGLEPEASLEVIAEPYSLVTNVLANALSNAIKFSPDGELLQLSVEEQGAEVILSVTDRGPGIPPDLLPHVFDFYQPTTRRGARGQKGTGFGLPILRMFMDRYGGSVETGPGKRTGTTLLLHFQRAPGEAAAAPPR